MIDLQTARGWRIVNRVGELEAEVDPDAALLALGRNGDRAALQRLLARHEGGLLRLCRGILGRHDDAEDAVQETFLRALRGLQRFRGESGVRTWLYRIAVNVCLEWKRARGNAHLSLHEHVEGIHPSPEEEVLLRARLTDALARLMPRQRAAILLKELHGFSVAEVGEAMGWSTVKAQNELYQARKQLLAWRQVESERDLREGHGQ